MIKTDLKEKWGKYTDTDKLVDNISALLTTYHHANTEHGICTMLDKYFEQKEPLINLFQKSDSYAGDMRIIMTKEFDRDTDRDGVKRFCDAFSNAVEAKTIILKDTDESGKKMLDYLKTGSRNFDLSVFSDDEIMRRLNIIKDNLEVFADNGCLNSSVQALNDFNAYMYNLRIITGSTITSSDKSYLDSVGNSEIKIATGMKTSRAFNRICTTYGVDRAPKYNRLFAEYADMVSGLSRSLDLVISVNPYDYLTMSFGKSWASCHTIDQTNQRGMDSHYHGAYCGGTLSYMLDKSSIITFVVDKGSDVQECGKIYRNMFHYQNHTMIQGRIYPQGNDGATDLYAKFRGFMQEEMAKMLGLAENKWTIKKGTSECNDWTDSRGVHYRDYLYNDDCNVCYPSEHKEDHGNVKIGADGICAKCGEIITSSDRIVHSRC